MTSSVPFVSLNMGGTPLPPERKIDIQTLRKVRTRRLKYRYIDNYYYHLDSRLSSERNKAVGECKTHVY
jgi:hypothetical protein